MPWKIFIPKLRLLIAICIADFGVSADRNRNMEINYI